MNSDFNKTLDKLEKTQQRMGQLKDEMRTNFREFRTAQNEYLMQMNAVIENPEEALAQVTDIVEKMMQELGRELLQQ